MEEEFVSWNDNLLVGVSIVDAQHKELVRLTNDLYKGCLMTESAEKKFYFEDAIRRSVDYVKEHFSTEEKLMEEANYPDIEAHKKEHRDFIAKVLEYLKDFGDSKRFASFNFVRFLRDWILAHIAVCDKKFAPCLTALEEKN